MSRADVDYALLSDRELGDAVVRVSVEEMDVAGETRYVAKLWRGDLFGVVLPASSHAMAWEMLKAGQAMCLQTVRDPGSEKTQWDVYYAMLNAGIEHVREAEA